MDNKNIIIIITSSFTQSPVGCAVTKPRRNNMTPLKASSSYSGHSYFAPKE